MDINREQIKHLIDELSDDDIAELMEFIMSLKDKREINVSEDAITELDDYNRRNGNR